jgi:hypothetical protein
MWKTTQCPTVPYPASEDSHWGETLAAASVERPLVKRDIFFNISAFTLERSPMNVNSVEKLSVRVLTSFTIREHTMVRSPTSVMNVTKPSVCFLLLFNIKECIME